MANAKETRSVKNNIGLALFILILVAMFFIPTSETLTAAGRNSLGLLLATIVCMLTGGLPIGVLCMLVIPLMYICGCVETPAAALAGFQNQSAFFMMASFGLTCAVTRVPLSRRLMRGIITKAGRNVNTVLLAIMLCCGLLSSIVSNIAACSAFIPLVLDFLSIYENEDERKRTGRCMLIALPTASMIGGMITPAGGAVNVIAITYLENLAGVNVTFLDWVAIFGPIAIVAFIAAYFIIRTVFKPAELTQDAIHHYLSKLEIPEKKVLFANPALPAVQDHEIAIFKEVAQKYDFDGLLLDRGRYDNIQSDFSDFSRREFEAYIGKKLDRFPEDVYAWEEDGDGGWRRIDGPYFKQWIEWRASVIYNFFKRTKEELKAVKPGLKFGAYTGAWYPSYFEVGVNWASNTYDPSQDFAWATPGYKNYGYAELLDIFTNGNYYWNVTVDEYRRSNGLHKNETDSEMSKGDHLSVEGGCRYSRRLLGGRPFFGGMYVEDYKRDTTRFKRAVEMNLRESDGLMVFDIVHIINRDWWGPLQRAVSAYEAEAKQ